MPAVLAANAADEVAPSCGAHAGAAATATCARCGRFLCVACLGTATSGETFCPDCRALRATERRAEAIRRLRTERWLSLAVLGIVVTALSGVLFARALRAAAEPVEVVVGAALLGALVVGLPMWLAAALFGAVRGAWALWPALALELISLFLWTSSLPDGNRAQLFALPLALYGISRTRRLRALVVRPAPAITTRAVEPARPA